MNTVLRVLLVLFATPWWAVANDYPTLDRVDYVLICMKKHGGQTIDNLYSCSCEIDAIASMISYDDFVEASTFDVYRNMPGERGAIFRDSERGEKVTAALHKAQEHAQRRCFIRSRASKSD